MKLRALKINLFNIFWHIAVLLHIKKEVSSEMPVTGEDYSNWKHLDDINLYKDNAYALKQLALLKKENVNILTNDKKVVFHSYWYGLITKKQLFSIKSFLCTQNLNSAELYLWIDESSFNETNISNLKILTPYITIKSYNPLKEAQGTIFEYLSTEIDQTYNLAERADTFRFLILYKYGGLYFDLDIMFLRDMRQLFENEFCYAWEQQCFANSAILFLNKQSLLATEILKKCRLKHRFVPWIILNYSDKKLKDMTVYPSAYFDPIWQEDKNKIYKLTIETFDDFFREFDTTFKKRIISYKDFFPGCYTYHWHNRWNAEEFEDSYFGLFDNEFTNIFNERNQILETSI